MKLKLKNETLQTMKGEHRGMKCWVRELKDRCMSSHPHGEHHEPCTLRGVINLHSCTLKRRYRVS
jgi:hypothetical protein